MNCVQLRLIIPSFGTSNRSSDRVMHQDKKSKENNSKSCKIMDLKLPLSSFYQWMKIQHFLQKVFQVTSNKDIRIQNRQYLDDMADTGSAHNISSFFLTKKNTRQSKKMNFLTRYYL